MLRINNKKCCEKYLIGINKAAKVVSSNKKLLIIDNTYNNNNDNIPHHY